MEAQDDIPDFSRVVAALQSNPWILDPQAVTDRLLAAGHAVDPNPDGQVVVSRVLDALREGTPFSYLRYGDGEADLAFQTPELCPWPVDDTIDHYVCNLLMDMQSLPVRRDYVALGQALRDALDAADIIGTIGTWRPFPLDLAWMENAIIRSPRGMVGHVRGVIGMDRYAQTQKRARQFASAHGYMAVIGAMTDLCGEARDIVCVTDQADAPSHLPAPARTIPTRDLAPHPPATPDDLCRALDQELGTERPGRLVLIGAGPFAEILCHHVQQRGEVGLDLGSGFDLLAGRRTRPVHRHFMKSLPRTKA